jgi:hypothetical protein
LLRKACRQQDYSGDDNCKTYFFHNVLPMRNQWQWGTAERFLCSRNPA